MTVLRFVLGDHLTRSVAALANLDPARDVVLMAEVAEETTYVRHHKQKIVLVLAAMRHFAAELEAEGVRVDYVRLDDPHNTGSFTGELARAVARHRPARVVVTEPGEWRVLRALRDAEAEIGVPIEVREDDRFYAGRARFRRWAEGRRGLRMEFFYRELRRETGILMQGTEPLGGRWNFDAENRKSLPGGHRAPRRLRFEPDATTEAVIALVETRFADHFGDVRPFGWPVTRGQALAALDHFVAEALPWFGDWQDAMQTGDGFLYHSLLSPAMNLGLLGAREVVAAAEAAHAAGAVPLPAAEGFVRQILGWREYVRGIYWWRMPAYADTNALAATRPLPWFFWSGETDMNCMAEAIGDIRRNAYGHHIQRLMVTGNFALLAGLRPAEVEAWYLAVYADAFEWVELPNTHGMALFADGGLLASKPYAASGAYIDRMSDYCGSCRYEVRQRTGPDACPFNALYWDFLERNAETLSGNPRLAMPYRTLARFDEAERARIRASARAFLDGLGDGTAGGPAPGRLAL